MATRRQLVIWSAATAGSLVLSASNSASAGAAGEPLAVVMARLGVLDSIAMHALKRLFLGESSLTPGGQRLIALNRDVSSPERTGFDRGVLGLAPEAVARYWIDRRIRGKSAAPRAVEPAFVLQRVVARLPGAIGYVRLSELTADVKVLRVDGRLPSDAGYPIVAGSDVRRTQGLLQAMLARSGLLSPRRE